MTTKGPGSDPRAFFFVFLTNSFNVSANTGILLTKEDVAYIASAGADAILPDSIDFIDKFNSLWKLSISPKDAIAQGMKGKDIGDYVKDKEMELFIKGPKRTKGIGY